MRRDSVDVVVVGAGPNGLTAAAVLSAAGLSVRVLEAASIGGGCRTEALTLPGFAHDVCSAIHPMAVVSPVFRWLRLEEHGLQWARAPVPLAHPLGDGRVAVLDRSLSRTAATLGQDGPAWDALMRPFVERHDDLFSEILRPVRVPRHPVLMARFGRLALRSANTLARRFRDAPARALFAGCAAHSFLDLRAPGSASFGLVLALAGHTVDWPCARGGSQQIANALAARARSTGCELLPHSPVRSLDDVPASRAVVFDVTPRQLEAIAGAYLPSAYRRRLRGYRYGPGAFKIDYALSGPIPWRDPQCARAATVHLGGTYEQIAGSEAAVAAGRVAETPFVLVAQQSMFDDSRAPSGQHTGWAYCHVPNASPIDVSERIEDQIERFAPGFGERVLARHVMPPEALEAHNANLVGGDIGGGANALSQFLMRPFARLDPYATPNPRIFMCSSSTPPGGGVHGMCGYWAARAVLRRRFGIRRWP